MSHILPQHSDLNNIVPSSLQSALQMDPNHQQQHIQQQSQPQQQQQPAQQSSSKRRKKPDSPSDEATSPSEPRRLRRSHEACARCRSKKIKCDAKHPRCTACATAGVPCHQEDRYRQTLTLRGHTERIEHQLNQCAALLKRHYPDFDLDSLDEILAREGVDVDANSPSISAAFQFGQPLSSRPISMHVDGAPQHPPPGPAKGYVYPTQMAPPGFSVGMPYSSPPGAHYPPHPHMIQAPPPGSYTHLYSPFQHSHSMHPAQPPQPRPPSVNNDIKGQDPQFNDLSNTEALAKTFGVSPIIYNGLKLGPGPADKEDLAVGSDGLASGRDRAISPTSVPRDEAKWVAIQIRRGSLVTAPPSALSPGSASSAPIISIWLPKDRKMVKHIVDVYFTRLNIHRPVFSRADFDQTLDVLYEGQGTQHDPGYICSLYIILALGTLSELSHRASEMDKDVDVPTGSPTVTKKLMPHDWPEHDEFFERALSVKPDLRVTISSLQALILLQWYLYTERQGRTLWRLVGSLVRLSIELGLHHDPTVQGNTFTEEECQLRIRLWGIVMVHDRGTSILLGRPLAIAPSDSNTPRPSRGKGSVQADFSEHFELSHPIAEIQADIINSLYTPAQQSRETIMRHATRIIKSMVEFRRQLPESYKWYFSGTEEWPLDKKAQLVQDITEDQGLTLLKIGIARILLLRALFSSKELLYEQRRKALYDAVVASHNVIIVHKQLIRFTDIAFFVSPIPLHIAAMVILYGHMSDCPRLTREGAVEDVWMALDMLPRLRWRWERKDVNGGHPLIARLAEQILNVNLRAVRPTRDPTLMSEKDWDADSAGMVSPPMAAQQLKSQQTTPIMAHASFPGSVIYGPHPRGAATPAKALNGSIPTGTPVDTKHFVDLPAGLFYPFYPENAPTPGNSMPGNGQNGNRQQDFNHLLAAAAAQPDGSYGSSQESFMLEETDPGSDRPPVVQMWINGQGTQRGMQQFAMQS